MDGVGPDRSTAVAADEGKVPSIWRGRTGQSKRQELAHGELPTPASDFGGAPELRRSARSDKEEVA